MPKETIKSCNTFTINQPVPGNPNASYALPVEDTIHVGWSNFTDGWVQVASLRSETILGTPNAPEHLSQPSGLYVNLDREGLNRLIRALRKARDRAFGADA
jgi:hypothetical protein